MRGVTFSEFGNGQNVDMFYNAPDCIPNIPIKEAKNTAIKIRNKYPCISILSTLCSKWFDTPV